QHPREAEVMVRVKMAQEDVLEVDEPDRGAEELALRALAAVEKEPVSSPPDEEGARAAPRRRRARGRAQEDDIEVHPAIVTTAWRQPVTAGGASRRERSRCRRGGSPAGSARSRS